MELFYHALRQLCQRAFGNVQTVSGIHLNNADLNNAGRNLLSRKSRGEKSQLRRITHDASGNPF